MASDNDVILSDDAIRSMRECVNNALESDVPYYPAEDFLEAIDCIVALKGQEAYWQERLDTAVGECRKLEAKLKRIQKVADEQVENVALWAFNVDPLSEAYLQQELRRLHAVIGKELGEE